MRVLIVSDTHGNLRNFEKVLEKEKGIDMLLHLGDVEKDEEYLEYIMDCPVYIVAGNNDFFSDLPNEIVVEIEGYRVFMTHGHGYYVSAHTRRLKEAAQCRRADIALYGHTHKPEIDLTGEVLVANPGSLSYPRQQGRNGSYIIMEISSEKGVKFSQQYV